LYKLININTIYLKEINKRKRKREKAARAASAWLARLTIEERPGQNWLASLADSRSAQLGLVLGPEAGRTAACCLHAHDPIVGSIGRWTTATCTRQFSAPCIARKETWLIGKISKIVLQVCQGSTPIKDKRATGFFGLT
jgi:hypothetical protein